MPPRSLRDYSDDELLYELLKLTRRQQWESEPLRFGCEVFSQHFSKPPAPMHRLILAQVTGQPATAPSVKGVGLPGAAAGVGECRPTVNTSLPFSPPVSPPHPERLTSVHPMNTTGEG